MTRLRPAALALLLTLSSALAPAAAQETGMDGDMPMVSTGIVLPRMDAAAGRQLFAAKGCVLCHAINGIGGEDAPPLDAAYMEPMMNPFDFAAGMWRGSEAMVALQRDELGEQIELTGQELADITAFVHDPAEQARFTMADIPAPISALMMNMDDGE
ncbi:MAG: c-type cytochrome [Pseudomonadota bacterium]